MSTLSCFPLFGIIILANGNNYHNLRSEDLIQKLSSLKGKHGLNFMHIEGPGSLLNHYKDSHPKLHYIEPGDPRYKQNTNPDNLNRMKNYNLLVAMNRFKGTSMQEKESKQISRTNSLRICKKVPKQFKCNNCDSEEKKKTEEEYNSNKKKERKRYYRAGYNNKQNTDDETAKLLDNLESLLAKNGKYNIFLDCVGDKCGGSSHTNRYEEGGDDANVARENMGCTCDRCGSAVLCGSLYDAEPLNEYYTDD